MTSIAGTTRHGQQHGHRITSQRASHTASQPQCRTATLTAATVPHRHTDCRHTDCHTLAGPAGSRLEAQTGPIPKTRIRQLHENMFKNDHFETLSRSNPRYGTKAPKHPFGDPSNPPGCHREFPGTSTQLLPLISALPQYHYPLALATCSAASFRSKLIFMSGVDIVWRWAWLGHYIVHNHTHGLARTHVSAQAPQADGWTCFGMASTTRPSRGMHTKAPPGGPQRGAATAGVATTVATPTTTRMWEMHDQERGWLGRPRVAGKAATPTTKTWQRRMHDGELGAFCRWLRPDVACPPPLLPFCRWLRPDVARRPPPLRPFRRWLRPDVAGRPPPPGRRRRSKLPNFGGCV